MAEVYHIPALLEPTMQGLNIRPDGIYVDVTFGGGGHSRAIMQRLGEQGTLFSMDQDIEAYEHEQKQGSLYGDARWHFIHGNFRYLDNFLAYYGVEYIDGLLADLGVSFHHFDAAQRGFSFRFDGPLDMRMNRAGGKTAADIVNTYESDALARVLYIYGECKNARALAQKLVTARSMQSIATTHDLVSALGYKDVEGRDKKDLARVFQALRIEVNDEMAALRELLLAAKAHLKPGGRIAVLTYHSLEDRIVKNFLRSGNLEGEIEKDFYGNILSPFQLIEKGRMADEDEVSRNPRARSAKLRVAEKK